MFQKKIIAGVNLPFSHAKYLLSGSLGEGVFGYVFSVMIDFGGSQQLGVMKILPQNRSSKEEDFSRECRIATLVRESADCVHLLDYGGMSKRGFDSFLRFNKLKDAWFLLFELCDGGDLSKFLQKMNLGDTMKLAKAMFGALAYLASKNIIHGDLKPANIFVKSSGKYVLGDFGLSYLEGEKIPNKGNIQSRWYRAPEVSLKAEPYTGAIDIWSLAAVLYECIKRAPLLPSSSDECHFSFIVNSVGGHYHQLSGAMQRGLKAVDPKFHTEFEAHHFPRNDIMFEDIDPSLMSLLDKMLVYNPEERLTASKALPSPIFNAWVLN